mgnify:CR=1 FL=1
MTATDIELTTGSSTQGIRYTVHRNGGASKFKGEETYTAYVSTDTAALGEVADAMVTRGCPYAKSYIVAVLTDMANVVGDLLRSGRAVNLGGLVTLRPTIKGTFEGEEGTFSSSANRLAVSASVGSKLRNVTMGSPTLKQSSVQLPTIEKLLNVADGSENTLCSKGQFMLTGARLTWDDTKEDEGFFLNLMGVETKCQTLLGDPQGKRLVLRTAQTMSVGDTLELWFRTRINGGLYQVKYNATITCVAAPSE